MNPHEIRNLVAAAMTEAKRHAWENGLERRTSSFLEDEATNEALYHLDRLVELAAGDVGAVA